MNKKDRSVYNDLMIKAMKQDLLDQKNSIQLATKKGKLKIKTTPNPTQKERN